MLFKKVFFLIHYSLVIYHIINYISDISFFLSSFIYIFIVTISLNYYFHLYFISIIIIFELLNNVYIYFLSIVDDSKEDESDEQEEEDDDDENARSELVDAILGMKDKAQDETAEKYRMEMDENEFNLAEDGTSLVDLSKVLNGATGHRTTKQQLRGLARSAYEGGVDVLDKPQAKATMEKQMRKEGYRMTSEDLDKWNETDKAFAGREYVSFPLNQQRTTQTLGSMTSTFTPTTDFEKGMAQLLNQTAEDKIQKEEDLKMIEMTPEQVLQRQRELARLRSLMFFQEIKAKRKAKIKSKQYHKILRREKAKQEEQTLKELAESDPEAAREYREKLEKDRMIERMTLKHKNTSKWAKQMQRKGLTKISSVRRAIEQQLEINRQLERKIAVLEEGEGGGEDESRFLLDKDKAAMNDSDESSDEAEEDLTGVNVHKRQTTKEQMRLNAIAKLKALDELNEKATGLLSLAFIAKDRAIQRASLQKFLDNIDDYDDDGNNMKEADAEEDSDVPDNDDDLQSDDEELKAERAKKRAAKKDRADKALAEALKRATEASGGRRVFKIDAAGNNTTGKSAGEGKDGSAKTANTPLRPKQFHAKITDSLTLSVRQALANRKKELEKAKKEQSDAAAHPDEENLFQEVPFEISNPIETEANSKTHMKLPTQSASSEGEHQTNEDEKSEEKKKAKAKAKSKKQAGKKGTGSAKATPNEWLDGAAEHAFDNGVDESEVAVGDIADANDDADRPPVLLGSGTASQKALLAQAFAEDDAIEEEWENEKHELARSEAEAGVGPGAELLAGWGSWTGEGTRVSKAQKARMRRKQNEHEMKVRKALKARKDAKMKNVIINQKHDKVASQFTLAKAPREFTKEQYNATLRVPMGKDWNTFSIHKAVIRPSVTVKKGAIIDPIKLSKQVKKQYTYGEPKKQ